MRIELEIFPLEHPYLPRDNEWRHYTDPQIPGGGVWETEFRTEKYRPPKQESKGYYHWSRFPEKEMRNSPWFRKRCEEERLEYDRFWSTFMNPYGGITPIPYHRDLVQSGI